jgi:hypothetical protein
MIGRERQGGRPEREQSKVGMREEGGVNAGRQRRGEDRKKTSASHKDPDALA